MKVWYGHGSEHSANLVIIGTFKTDQDAADTERLIRQMIEVVEEDAQAGRIEAGEPVKEFSERLMQVSKSENFWTFSYGDPGELLFEHVIERDRNRIVVTTEDQQINALLKMLVHGSAKVEVYSAHAYPSPYGRPTYSGDVPE
jgi:Family of unknown function (DUF6375)